MDFSPLKWLKQCLGLGSPFSIITKDAMAADPRAVLVGINAYEQAPLRGCVFDRKSYTKLLAGPYSGIGYNDTNIRFLDDADATRSNILGLLDWLMETQGPKTYGFSGHGTQWPDESEADGFLEASCPVDFQWRRDRMIVDRDYVEKFQNARGIFNWISDSCHSGDLTRAIGNPHPENRPKSMPIPPQIMALLRYTRRNNIFRLPRAMRHMMNVGFISGCTATQTSADAFIDGEFCGAMSYFFLQALGLNRESPLNDVVARVRLALQRAGYAQEPQCEGSRCHNPFLG